MQTTFEKTGGTYRQEGNYLLPNIKVPESPQIGTWGERRRRYLREHQKALYTAMMLSDALNIHLQEVDRSAIQMYDHLTLLLANQEGITEQLKSTDQVEWIQQMNNICNCVTELVNQELIYV